MNMAEANEVASLPLTALNTCNSLLYVLPCFSYLLLIVHSVACPDESTTRGYLLNLLIMIASSVHKSSAGKALANHLSHSSACAR